MKYFLFAIFICTTLVTNADTVDKEINRACLQQAASLVKQIKTELFPDMKQEESNKITRMSVDNCIQQFSDKPMVKVVKENIDQTGDSEQVEKDEESGDWLTDLILKNEVERKAGNKRLERMRRK